MRRILFGEEQPDERAVRAFKKAEVNLDKVLENYGGNKEPADSPV